MNYPKLIRLLLTSLLLVISPAVFAETMNFSIQYLGVTWIKAVMSDVRNSDGGTLTIRARSTGLAESWAQTDNTYEIDYRGDYLPQTYRKHIRQKSYREESTTSYRRDLLTGRYEDRMSKRLPRTYKIDAEVRDFFSALYALRTHTQSGSLPLDANGLIWRAEVRNLGIDRISTVFGKVACDKIQIRFRKVSPGEKQNSDMLTNNLVGADRTLVFWITRDQHHAPVRAEYKLFPFSVVWKLESYTP